MRHIRPFRPADAAALDRVCIATGHHGGDAHDLYDDPTLLCELYLRPYLALQPELAFVLADDAGDRQLHAPLGYVVGAADTREFAAVCEQRWWPLLRSRWARPEPGDMSPDAQLLRRLHDGLELELLPFLGAYPAHLHIDLLPLAQGLGWGRRLLEQLFAALRERGALGVHLGVSGLNTTAIAFYHRVGFETLQEQPWGRWMGLRL